MEHEQQLWLLSCLTASLEAEHETRIAAEQALNEASLRPGYGVALANVVLNTNLAMGLRQLAAVLLKQYVKQHWVEEEKGYVPPIVTPEDKATIRALLPSALGDPHGKIRTAVGMAIATIATSDWPEEWPDLMSYILECINDRSDINKVHGALRCLALFSGDIDDRQVPHLVPVLFPSLYAIVSSPSTYDSSMRKGALTVLHSCVATLGIMSSQYQPETKALMSPMLKAWMEQFASILAVPVQPENPDDWGLKMEVLKALLQIVQNFPKLAFNEIFVVVGQLWQTFVSGLGVYEVAAVEGDQEVFSGLACSDGSDQSLESFIIQLFEFLICLVGLPRYTKLVQKYIKDLTYHTIGYMQITEEQVGCWSEDPNQYITDEDEMGYSCRVSATVFLEEIAGKHEKTGVLSILEAVSKRIEEAEVAKSEGKVNWWKLREAAVMATGNIDFMEFGDVSGFNLDVFVDNVLLEDLRRGMNSFPFLYGRALWAAAKLHSFISEDKRDAFFLAAIEGLSHNSAPVVVGSCRALIILVKDVSKSVYEPHLAAMYSALGLLLRKASEEMIHLTLEVIQSVVSTTQSPAADSILSPLLLDVWVEHVAEPFITLDALETLEAIKDIPGCTENFIMRLLPPVADILAQRQDPQTGIVAGALDFLTMLLKGAPIEAVNKIYTVTFNSLINLLIQSDDSTELQNATESLTSFIHHAGENVLSWSADPNLTMRRLLDIAARLLHPDMESSGSFYAGKYLVQLIQGLSSYMAPYLRDLITALVMRMESVNLQVSLILVFAKLVHMSAPNYSQFIDLLASVPSKKYGNALNCVMYEWTKSHCEIQGSYSIKVSTTALAQLLACGHPQIASIAVRGRLIESGRGIMTRSRKKEQPDKWSTVPLLQKIFSLLAETLAEFQEDQSDGLDEADDDWEDASDAEDEEQRAPPLSNVFQPAEGFEHLLKEPEEDDSVDDPAAESDPINKINLQAYLVTFLKNFAQAAQPLFTDLFKTLSDTEKATVQAALAS